MRAILPILIMTLSLSQAGLAAPASAPRDMLIVPGDRAGAVALGMTPAELTASVGTPADVQHQGPDTIYSWGDVTAEISDKSPNVDLISVNDPRYETADHVRVGLAVFAVMAVLGDPVKITNALGIQDLEYDGMTIVVRNNLVAQIRVRK
ncbi:MAG TPA: hypothetical protein VGM72_11810 [Micropepsaceae bacterium]|jgi:hypothetical protein